MCEAKKTFRGKLETVTLLLEELLIVGSSAFNIFFYLERYSERDLSSWGVMHTPSASPGFSPWGSI